MRIRLFRHATLGVEMNGQRILVDPVLSPSGDIPPIPGVANEAANPLVELPDDPATLADVDAVLVTHTHIDHFDDAAQRILPKSIQIFCQPTDRTKIAAAGFKQIDPIDEPVEWQGILIRRVGGQHGTGKLAEKMGPVSGFVLSAPGEPTLYITGDTIWCAEVEMAIKEYSPEVIVCFAGAAQFASGDPITMSKYDIIEVCEAAPKAKVVAVHMEAWNHCRLSRQELADFITEKGVAEQVFIPDNSEVINFDIRTHN